MLQFTLLSTMILASAAATTAAAAAESSTARGVSPGLNGQLQRKQPSTRHRRRRGRSNGGEGASHRRRLAANNSLETTGNSADDMEDGGGTQAAASTPTNSSTAQRQSDELCTPTGECELCPHNWKVLIEKEDEKVKGEYDSCLKYGRRELFECTVLFQDDESSEKTARSHSEYRSCRYTDSDEQFRMFRMQLICLLVGIWSMRNVRRQRVVSASLFDQRRMRIQNSSNGSGGARSNVKYSSLPSKSSSGAVELTRQSLVGAKVPKSPAPNPNMQTV